MIAADTIMLSAAKDLMTSSATKAYVNKFIEPYGTVDELKIDSKRSRIEVVCRLDGELDLIGVTIERYRIEAKDGRKFLHVVESSATRPWLQAVMRDHLHGRKVELPSWVATVL